MRKEEIFFGYYKINKRKWRLQWKLQYITGNYTMQKGKEMKIYNWLTKTPDRFLRFWDSILQLLTFLSWLPYPTEREREREWERTITVCRLAKSMTETTIRASTLTGGFEGECSDHRECVFWTYCKSKLNYGEKNEFVGEQHSGYDP